MKRLLILIFFVLLIGGAALLLWPEKAYKPYVVPDSYQAQVDTFFLPEMPADWQWREFTAADGTNIRWGETGNAGTAKASLIIVPGFTATMDMYGEHADMLAERGYHVIGFDLRGQGGSERHFKDQPERLWIDDFSVYSDDLAGFIQAKNIQGRPVIPIGNSFGGHVATRMVKENNGLVDGLFLMAPAIEPKAGEIPFEEAGEQMAMAQKLGQGKKYVPGGLDWRPATPDDLRTNGIEYCSSNPDRLPYRDVVFTRKPEQRVGAVTVQWGAEFFESARLMKAEGYFDDISLPVAIAAADVDLFVENAAIDKACAEMQNCQLIRYPGSGHCLMQEVDPVIAGMMDQIDQLFDRVTVKSP